MRRFPPPAVLAVPLLFLIRLPPGVCAQPSEDPDQEWDSRKRITLEDVLTFDPSDAWCGDGAPDRDPAEDFETVVPPRLSFRPSRTGLTFGYAGRGGEQNGWTGSADRAIIRADLRVDPRIGFGFMGEKDAGERWDLGFRSAYIAVQGLPLDGECFLGDYRVQSACGVVIGGGAAPMGFDEMYRRIEKNRPPLVPHRSRDENRFLRGAAVRFSPMVRPALPCVLFVSRRTRPSTGDGSSVSTNSLFRTEGEISRMNGIRETILGGRLGVEAEGIGSLSVTLLRSRLESNSGSDVPGMPAGRTTTLVGTEFSVQADPVRLKGEVAGSEGRVMAAVVMGGFAIGRTAAIALAVQSLSARFANHRFEGLLTSAGSNETSYRLSAQCRLFGTARFEGYIRQRWTPGVPPGRLSRSEGWNGGISGTVGLGRGWILNCSCRFRRGDDEASTALPEGGSQRIKVFTGGGGARISLRYGLDAFECRTSFQFAWSAKKTRGASATGDHARQEIDWKPSAWLAVSMSGTVYSADEYSVRTTSLEDDAIARLRYEPLSGEGFRWTAALKVAPPGTGLSVVILVAATKPGAGLQSEPAGRRVEWGVRLQWAE